MPRQSFQLILQSVRDIAPQVRHFTFAREDGVEMDFIPGQFITFLMESGDKTLRRSYSLASAPQAGGALELAASYVEGGRASDILFNLNIGETLTATGPFGRLVLPEQRYRRYILVATGTGVTPYRAMLPVLAQRMQEEQAQVTVLQGVRYQDDLLYADDFLQFQKEHENFQYLACYSRAQVADCEPYERCHRVQRSFTELALDPEQDVVFLCGNPLMIDEAFVYLTECGFATANIKREKYISSN